MCHWLTGRPFRVVARGRLSAAAFRWAAVPGRQAGAFMDRHPAAVNALSFAHVARGLAARFPETAGRAAQALDELRALEDAFPGHVLFVLDCMEL